VSSSSNAAPSNSIGIGGSESWTITLGPKDGYFIDIGDYENQFEAWNKQNMLDYQMRVVFYTRFNGNIDRNNAIVTVKNGIPESSDPSYFLTTTEPKTIQEVYSLIKRVEEDITNDLEKGSLACWLKVTYNAEYYYPSNITWTRSNGINNERQITLTPPEETEQETGDGEE
jgi:hypothetical protein